MLHLLCSSKFNANLANPPLGNPVYMSYLPYLNPANAFKLEGVADAFSVPRIGSLPFSFHVRFGVLSALSSSSSLSFSLSLMGEF
jgi:hypothetical protein